MMPYDLISHGLRERRKIRWKVLRGVIVCLFLLFALLQFLSFNIASVHSQSSSLLVFAEAPSFARLDNIDPSGWFYQAVLYNPTDNDIVVTGLRWWYNASVGVDFVDAGRNARCSDSRYFLGLPSQWISADDDAVRWQYNVGTISLTVPSKEIIVTWIEVPTNSRNNDGIATTYYVQAYADGQWISSPLYASHSGHDHIASTVFRADLNLTTDPNDELQTHPDPEWLFNEDRSVIAGSSTRVRLIPVTSSRSTLGINYSTVNITFPLGWSYVPSSAYNPYSETITPHYVDGKDRLEWDLNSDVLRYSTNQSMAQNYIEFNVTAPYVPGIHNFTVNSVITSFRPRTSMENQCIYIVVKTPPNATFKYSPPTPLTGETVTFNATASYDLDGQIVSYFWDFGDENTGTGNITTHAYANNGNCTVTLIITDNEGLNSTASDTIRVLNRPPVAKFTESSEIVDTDVVIYFNASESYDLDGFIVSYFWNFGDDANETGALVNHTYTDDGIYTVVLTVTDDDGATTSANATKTILNRPPVAIFTESAEIVYTHEFIYFNASDSYDSDGEVVSYFWDFGDGTNATGVTVSHSYAEDGSFTVNLTVTDDDGSSVVATHVLTILNRVPVASFIIFPEQPVADDSITFNAVDSYDPDGTIVNYVWDFGDGNITATGSGVITHIYHEYGDFNVTLTMVDNDGYNNTTSQIIAVHVHDVAILNTTVSQTEVHVGQVVNITVTVKNDGTTTESFNVTVFRNGTLVGTQLVSNLAPNAEKILYFYWNTTGITPNMSYVIQAEASAVAGETDIFDNTYSCGIVKVESQDPPPFDWGPIIPYVAPIGSAVIAVILVIVAKKELLGLLLGALGGLSWLKKRKRRKGFEFFDEMTDGGIPDSFSVLISGEPGSGKSMLCQQLAHAFLTKENSCIYITYDSFPDEVRENMEKFHWNISKYGNEAKLVFIDSFSSIAKVTSKEKYSVNQPFSLSDLGITMSTATNEMANVSRVFLDSIVPLLTHIAPSKVVEFLQNRSARIKGVKGTFIFTLGKETIEPSLISRLEEAVDCVIELEVSKGKTVRRMRIKKMRGRETSSKWVRFEINSEKGIVFLA